MSSSGSNLGPRNPALADAVKDRIKRCATPIRATTTPVPVDLITASGSGLDPHISVAAANYQAPRVAKVRNVPLTQVQALVAEHTENRTLGVLGESRVNVLGLNRALDRAAKSNALHRHRNKGASKFSIAPEAVTDAGNP